MCIIVRNMLCVTVTLVRIRVSVGGLVECVYFALLGPHL